MSNRYVWGRFNITPVLFVDSSHWGGISVKGSPVTILMTTNSANLSPSGGGWPRDASINSGDTATIDLYDQYLVPPNTYFSFKGTSFGYSEVFYSRDVSISCDVIPQTIGAYVSIRFNGGSGGPGKALYNASKGTANGTVSNSASSTYPPRDYVSKSARIWPYSVPFMRCSGRSPEYATKPLELDALSR